MNEEEAKEIALSFLMSEKTSLRSSDFKNMTAASVESEQYDITVIAGSGEKEVKQEIPVYTVNYKDASGEDAGYVVLAGDERISDNVLIFSDAKGADFNMDEREDSDFLKDLIAGYLHNNINSGEDGNVDAISTRALPGQVAEYGNATEYLLPYWVNFGQNIDPFNRYTPFAGGSRTLAGCTAVAMSEIMAYHGWPLHGTFKRYTTNTSTPETVTVSYQLTAKERAGVLASNMDYCQAFYPNALEYVANLLVETGMISFTFQTFMLEYVANLLVETGYRLNSFYGKSETIAYPSDVPRVFVEMGYTTDVYQKYSYSAIANDIENRELPVYMAGWTKKDKDYGGHAYVIYGTYHRKNGERFIFLVEGNNRKQGMYKDPETGYYYNLFNANMFSTDQKEPPNYTPSVDFPDVIYPYRYDCKIITNIKPNPNKTGSTNPDWRVSSYFPY